MCIIAFQDEADSPVDFSRHFRAAWPTSAPVTGTSEENHIVSFKVGGVPVIVGRMSAPVPEVDINEDQRTPFWPDAEQDLQRHQTHWIVTVLELGRKREIEQAYRWMDEIAYPDTQGKKHQISVLECLETQIQ